MPDHIVGAGLVLIGLGWLAGRYVIRPFTDWLFRCNDAAVDRHVTAALGPAAWDDAALLRLCAALDETTETYDDALAIANDNSFDRTLAEIRALPTKESA